VSSRQHRRRVNHLARDEVGYVAARQTPPPAAELHTAQLRRGQCVPRALSGHAQLLFRDHGHDAYREAVCVRHVDHNEVDTGLLEAEQGVRITRQTIESGND
jgi:hypothetical protein